MLGVCERASRTKETFESSDEHSPPNRSSRGINKAQEIQLVTSSSLEPDNLPSIGCSEGATVTRGSSRAEGAAGTRGGEDVEISRVVVLLSSAQLGLGPILG